MRQRRGSLAGAAFFATCLSLGSAPQAAAESAFQVKDIDGVTASTMPWEHTAVSGGLFEPPTLFFTADVAGLGRELWKSDGTEMGTVLVKDILAGPSSPDPANLTHVAAGFGPGRLFFTASSGLSGEELWTSDGTASGTVLLKNVNPAWLASSSPANLTAVHGGLFTSGRLFFTADDGTSGVELWVTDGTTLGTVCVKDIYPGPSPSAPSGLVAVGTSVFFIADDGVAGRELWKSDGSELGTVRVKDIDPGPSQSYGAHLTNVGGTLFFSAFTEGAGVELWKSNGTEAGTTLVKDIRPGGGVPASSLPGQLVAVGSTLFFTADNGTSGRELWKSDGSLAGTVLVANINPLGSAFVGWESSVAVGGLLFFVADDGTYGRELWRSDGTAAGTVLVKDILPGPDQSQAGDFADVNGTLFFLAKDSEFNRELWRSDGRPEGTYVVRDIEPGPFASDSFGLTVCWPFLFFTAITSAAGGELWATDLLSRDGFESGTARVWSSANTGGGDLAVEAAAALHGTAGLAAHVDDTASLFVTDESPNNERRYRARFRLDPNGFDPGEANGKLRVRVFIAFEEDPTVRLITLVLRRIGGQYGLMGRVRLEDGTRAQTPFVTLTDAMHMVEIDWQWSEGQDANNGAFTLWIDEVPVSILSGLDNSDGLVDFVRLGAMTVKPGANGTLYFDDFESRRERYIGYLP